MTRCSLVLFVAACSAQQLPNDTGVQPDSGAADSGAADSGAVDSGAVDSGAVDSGAVDSGAADSGAADSGAADSGARDGGCPDERFEPNDNPDAATPLPAAPTAGLWVCAADQDWYVSTVPAGAIATVSVVHGRAIGDLEFAAYDANAACLGARLQQGTCNPSSLRSYETDAEVLTVLNGAATPARRYFAVSGYAGSLNDYTLSVRTLSFSDGPDCTAAFPAAECQGRPDAGGELMQFPFADPADAVGDAYRLDSPANYRWARRETVMLVRWALRQTRARFPGTTPIAVLDAAQVDGVTPGYDVAAPRHPQSTHDQGASVDLAYFNTLGGGYHDARAICDATGGSHDGMFCTAAATAQHVVDLPRQTYLLAQLFSSPRVRVIGVDQVIAPLVVTEADRQLGLGWITQAQRDAFNTKLASGSGWQFMFRSFHLSLLWW